MNQHDQARLAREIEDAVERPVGEAWLAAGHLGRDKLLVDRELADAAEHAGKGLQHPPDMVRGLHVRRVEARDHGIEAGPVCLAE